MGILMFTAEVGRWGLETPWASGRDGEGHGGKDGSEMLLRPGGGEKMVYGF